MSRDLPPETSIGSTWLGRVPLLLAASPILVIAVCATLLVVLPDFSIGGRFAAAAAAVVSWWFVVVAVRISTSKDLIRLVVSRERLVFEQTSGAAPDIVERDQVERVVIVQFQRAGAFEIVPQGPGHQDIAVRGVTGWTQVSTWRIRRVLARYGWPSVMTSSMFPGVEWWPKAGDPPPPPTAGA